MLFVHTKSKNYSVFVLVGIICIKVEIGLVDVYIPTKHG